MRLRYTSNAAAELEEILSYIDERSATGACKVMARVQATLDLLLVHPGAGQRTSRGRLRRLVAHPYPCLILYEATGEEIIAMKCVTTPAGHRQCRTAGDARVGLSRLPSSSPPVMPDPQNGESHGDSRRADLR